MDRLLSLNRPKGVVPSLQKCGITRILEQSGTLDPGIQDPKEPFVFCRETHFFINVLIAGQELDQDLDVDLDNPLRSKF